MLAAANRKIHLDFHTPSYVRDVGGQFDPERLVQLWKDTHVNAVTAVFGLCACGNAYYESSAAPVHPGLRRDMLAALLPAAKREGIAVYVHFGPGINDKAVIAHPEWAMKTRTGKVFDTDGGKEWGWPCYNSPYIREWFFPQLADFVPRFPDVSGIFIDMVMMPEDTCYCDYCLEQAGIHGLNPDSRDDMDLLSDITLRSFMKEAKAIVKSLNPSMAFTCNCRWFVGGARDDSLDYLELEAPVSWNSYHYPVMSRYLRTLPIPSGGMTTRFPHSWGYFGSLNSEQQVKFECASILATLGACCIGDQLHPSGVPEPGVYELVRAAYEFVKEREQWTIGARSVPYVGLMADNQRNASIAFFEKAGDYYAPHQAPAAFYGSGLLMLEGSRHFDVLDEQSDIAEYRMIWLPENKTLSPGLIEKLASYVSNGGRLLITGAELWRSDAWRERLEEMLGLRCSGFEEGGMYIRAVSSAEQGGPAVPHYVKGCSVRWTHVQGAQVLAERVGTFENIPITQKFGHFHPPAGTEGQGPAALLNSYGKGRIAAVAAAAAADYFQSGSGFLRRFILDVMDRLLDVNERLVEAGEPASSIDLSLMEQLGRWIVHLVQYHAKRHTGHTVVDDIPVRRHIPVVLRPPFKPRRVYLAPDGCDLPWNWSEDGACRVTVPYLHIHQMLVVEFV